MGKDSLTKSTTKKKSAAKKKKDQTVEKAVAKKTAVPSPEPSLRDLLHKKFETVAPEPLYKPPVPATAGKDFSAPPFYATSDPREAQRVRALMFQKFSLADMETAAKAETEARLKAEAKAKAETEARLKAEADAKAEAEARLKAEAKELAAERAIASQVAAASEPKVSVTYGNGSGPASSPPVDKTGRWVTMGIAGGIALLFLLLICASLANTGKYYLKPTDRGLEIWQGKFAPIGTRQALFLPGIAAPQVLQPVYTRAEVMPLAVAYFLAQADAILAESAIPDFQRVQAQLHTALDDATGHEEKKAIRARLDGIDRAILIYKAEVGASRQTIDGYAEAINNYRQALRVTDNDVEIQALKTRIAAAEQARTELKENLAREAAAAEASTTAETKPAD